MPWIKAWCDELARPLCRPRALFIDLDLTLWNHSNLSLTNPPYTRVGVNAIVDSRGERIELNYGAREFLEWAREAGLMLFTLSWNEPAKAVKALKALGVDALFNGIYVEPHHRKDLVMLKALKDLEEKGISLKPCEIIYVDDREIHGEQVKNSVGDVVFVLMWKDVKDFIELRKFVNELLNAQCIT